MSYKSVEIWQLSRTLVIDVHEMTNRLPGFEQFEEAKQIRRSVKSTGPISWRDMAEESIPKTIEGSLFML